MFYQKRNIDVQGKFYAYYWGFKELKQAGLTKEDLWFTCCLLRSPKVAQLEGGVSALTLEVEKLFRPLAAGLVVSWHSGSRQMLFARLKGLLGDEAALKAMWGVKGASGTLPCLLCDNVVQSRSNLHKYDITGTLVPHTEFNMRRLRLRTSQFFADAATRLSNERARRSKKDFEVLEQSLGVNYSPNGLLFDPACHLKAAEHTMFDWLHVYLVNGIFQTEVNLLLPILKHYGLTHERLSQFFSAFSAPKEHAGILKAAILTFEKCKNKEWKPSASEVLCTYSLIRLAVLDCHLEDEHHKVAGTSFLLLCKILDLLSLIGKDLHVDHQKLAETILAHLQAFKNAYGEDSLVPKFHYSMHLPRLLHIHGLLLSCWVHERKHKTLKRWADQLHNAGSWFEASVLQEATHSSINSLKDFQPSACSLVRPKLSSVVKLRSADLEFLRSMPNILVATCANVFGLTCHSGDVVLLSSPQGADAVAEIHVFTMMPDGQMLALCNYWETLGKNRFRAGDLAHWVAISHLRQRLYIVSVRAVLG